MRRLLPFLILQACWLSGGEVDEVDDSDATIDTDTVETETETESETDDTDAETDDTDVETDTADTDTDSEVIEETDIPETALPEETDTDTESDTDVDTDSDSDVDSDTDLPTCIDVALAQQPNLQTSGDLAAAGDDFTSACAVTPGATDLAYEYIAPQRGCYIFGATSTVPSTTDLTLSLVNGCGSEIVCNNDRFNHQGLAAGRQQRAPVIHRSLNTGDAVTVVVDGATPADVGTFQLGVTRGTQLVADTNLGSATGRVVNNGTNARQTTTISDTTGCPSATGDDIIYRWTAPATGTYAFRVFQADFDASISLHRPCDEAPFTCADTAKPAVGNDDQIVRMRLHEDEPILIRVAGRPTTLLIFPTGFESGQFDLSIAADGP